MPTVDLRDIGNPVEIVGSPVGRCPDKHGLRWDERGRRILTLATCLRLRPVTPSLTLEFESTLVHWRGPSPFHFVPVPDDEASIIHDVASVVSYGWGVIPVRARIGDVEYTTSLFPKNGGYLVPVKDVVRNGVGLAIGDEVAVTLVIDMAKA
jgi:hypothetical protein